MSGLFLTASGTEIGKTYVTCRLIETLRRRNSPVDALKPVVSGIDPGRPEGSDPALLLAALGRALTPEALAAISPFRFRAALSPHMAAPREGRALDPAALAELCRAAAARGDRLTLIEGVGGVMVPLTGSHTVLDWMKALGLPALLVTGSYLGAISHTLTAVEALERRALGLVALIVNESPQAEVPLMETVDTLARFLPGRPVVVVRRGEEAASPAFERLADLALASAQGPSP